MPDQPTVLIVDDEPAMQRLMSSLLSWNGFTIISAFNVNEAEALLQTERPNVILCDLMMPERTGVELIQYCRAHDELREVPIVLVTATGQHEKIDEAIALGVFELLPKPFATTSLLRIVRAATGQEEG